MSDGMVASLGDCPAGADGHRPPPARVLTPPPCPPAHLRARRHLSRPLGLGGPIRRTEREKDDVPCL
eukprot:8915200-Pyramimonas_sp.AAC.1